MFFLPFPPPLHCAGSEYRAPENSLDLGVSPVHCTMAVVYWLDQVHMLLLNFTVT